MYLKFGWLNHLNVFQLSNDPEEKNALVFEWCPTTLPFNKHTVLDHLNNGLVWYSNGQIINIFVLF
jgi:hypothetical protein